MSSNKVKQKMDSSDLVMSEVFEYLDNDEDAQQYFENERDNYGEDPDDEWHENQSNLNTWIKGELISCFVLDDDDVDYQYWMDEFDWVFEEWLLHRHKGVAV